MNSFSTQRYFSLFHFRLGALLLLLLSSVSGAAALEQSSGNLFRGTWQIDTPDQGALIIIVKRNGLASFFWGDNIDRTVYPGNWTSSEQAATITWRDGSKHRIERDALGFNISYTDSRSKQQYSVPAQQVPKEVLGQWAKPPTKALDLISARDKAKGFFGIWKIQSGDTNQYLFIEADRSAASNWGDSRGLRGAWAKQGSELHIVWDSGHYSILRENERGFAYKQIEPGQLIETDSSEFHATVRTTTEQLPAAWLSDYQAERQLHTGGIAFSSREIARDFYRGTWIVRRAENAYERIEIGRFGGLNTSRDRSLQGAWRMEGQDIFMRWDDGMRKILSPIGHGFLLYEYKPGRPLDGVPTRIFAAGPADASKLSEHLKGREDVALQMLNLAEAAGINSVEPDTGWGRTFARWAWPFGEDEFDASPDRLLDEGYGATQGKDPWWWPFWSEKSKDTGLNSAKTPTPEAPRAEETAESTATVTTAAEQSAPQTGSASTQKSATRPTKKSWNWPF